MDLSVIPVVDSHCHLFDLKNEKRSLSKILNFSLDEMPEEQLSNTLFYKQMVRKLGKLLNHDGNDSDILKLREESMDKNYKAYVTKMFEDVKMDTLLVDLGYKPATVNLQTFENLVPCQVKYIYRTETILDIVWQEKLSLQDGEKLLDQEIDNAIRTLDIRGIKSIIGYRTGLAINPEHKKLKSYKQEKEFRDYFLLKTLEKSIDANLTIQIHTSFGESNNDLIVNNPLLFRNVLEDGDYSKAKIVFVHGGYPYSFETGYLAAMYPNVYIDISEMVPYVPLGFKKGIRDIFDLCPLNKIMFGSDGLIIPETHWIGAKVAKKEIARLLQELVGEGYFTEGYAATVAKYIFYQTADELYNLQRKNDNLL